MKQFLKCLPLALLLVAGVSHAQLSQVYTATAPVAGVVYSDTCAYTAAATEVLGRRLQIDRGDSTGVREFVYGRIWGGVVTNQAGRVLYDTSAVNGKFNFTTIAPPLDSTMVATSYSVTKSVAGILCGAPTYGQFGWVLVRSSYCTVRMAAPASGVAYVAGTAIAGTAGGGLAGAAALTVGAYNGQNTRTVLPAGAVFGNIRKTAVADTTLVNAAIHCP